ncbi:hypothetical protein GCM10009550_75170 [Actinocorallia libanotica]|uniref:Uncharacterized protein n=2 Tax=Actinocorallia libanotica TaxID=46162 RepID=A0ABN1S0A7_9ACTN
MTTPDSGGPYWCPPHPVEADPLPRDGRRNCGFWEAILRRQWDPARGLPSAETIAVIDRIAAQPSHIAALVINALDELWVGEGNVPDLNHLGYLAGQPVRPGSPITWDEVPGVTVGRIVAIGTGRTVSASLLDHELGHVIERTRRMAEQPDWQIIMHLCRPHFAYDRWLDPLEWWAEGWALITTNQLDRLNRILNGHREVTEMVARYYVRRYGLEVITG